MDTDAFCPEPERGRDGGGGSLVMHIRSGDVFDNETTFQVLGFGQVSLALRWMAQFAIQVRSMFIPRIQPLIARVDAHNF